MAGIEGALFGLSAAAAFGVSDLGGTVASRRLGSTRTTGIVVPISAVMLIAIFLATGSRLPTSPGALALCAVSGLFGSLAYFAAYAALRAGPITVVIPIMFAYGGLAVLLSIAFLGEQPSPANILAAMVATIGVVLLGATLGGTTKVRLSGRGVGYALVVLVAAAGAAIVGTLAVRQADWLPALTVARATNASIVLSVIAVLGLRRRVGKDLRPAGQVANPALPRGAEGARFIGLVVVIAALEVVAVSALFAGFHVGPTWLVALTSSFSPLIGIVGGVTLFRERPSRLQWLGGALVLLSALLLAVR